MVFQASIFINLKCFSFLKVFTLFLDTLQELILVHKEDLQDWLYVLLTRLFNKLGADLLNSILSKINKILDLIRYYSYLDIFFSACPTY